jgi:F-type H+-transporting ATPase subunit a
LNLTSDQMIFWQHGFFKLNETIVTTWAMMFLMTVGAMLVTRKLVTEGKISRWQSGLEIIVTALQGQIKEIGLADTGIYLPFLGTLFLFVVLCSLLIVFPVYRPPTGSLSPWLFVSLAT